LNASCEAPGTWATRSRWDSVTPQPPPFFSRETAAVVRRLFAVRPAFPSSADSAIVKQPACAAATSSSGFVPFSPSKRVENEYGVCDSTPLSVVSDPFPVLRSPCHCAVACLFIASPSALRGMRQRGGWRGDPGGATDSIGDRDDGESESVATPPPKSPA